MCMSKHTLEETSTKHRGVSRSLKETGLSGFHSLGVACMYFLKYVDLSFNLQSGVLVKLFQAQHKIFNLHTPLELFLHSLIYLLPLRPWHFDKSLSTMFNFTPQNRLKWQKFTTALFRNKAKDSNVNNPSGGTEVTDS